jgi:hypothetical protein
MERYVLDAFDFKTLHYAINPSLNMRAPINGASLVTLYVRGKKVAATDPTWGFQVVPDPARIQGSYPFSMIQLKKPVRDTTSILEVNYVTLQGFCMKCAAKGVLADWEIGHNRSLMRTTNLFKLAQACTKRILTSKNPFNPTDTCPIKTYIGAEFGITITDEDISSAIVTVLTRLQAVQNIQATIQTLSPLEVLENITSILSQQSADDPTVVTTDVVVSANGSSQPLALNFLLQGKT